MNALSTDVLFVAVLLARHVLDYYQVIKGKLASAIKAHAQYPTISYLFYR